MIRRTIERLVFNELTPGKAVLVYGARRVGKTVLINEIAKNYQGKATILNGEDYSTAAMFAERTASNYRHLLSGTELLVIDEAHNIKDIGFILKLIVDEVRDVAVLATGSSSFDLFQQTGEPLVGRSYEFKLFPFSTEELLQKEKTADAVRKIEERLVFGAYPEVENNENIERKQIYLSEIANAYLLKDILMIDGIKNSSKMRDLLRLVAFQCGNVVSYDELAKQLSLARNTVEKYLDLLTKTFVIFKLPAYSRNPRKEISKSAKWFFYDNGIRNAVIGDFRPLSVRQDKGMLWENFIISERIKFFYNRRKAVRFYFWRSYAGQEIDLIEEQNTVISAWEIKWSKEKNRPPSAFSREYPAVPFGTIHRNNYIELMTV